MSTVTNAWGQFDLFDIPEEAPPDNRAANLARAIAEHGDAIGRRVAAMRLFPDPAGGLAVRRRCEGTITGVRGGLVDYLPYFDVDWDGERLTGWTLRADTAEIL